MKKLLRFAPLKVGVALLLMSGLASAAPGRLISNAPLSDGPSLCSATKTYNLPSRGLNPGELFSPVAQGMTGCKPTGPAVSTTSTECVSGAPSTKTLLYKTCSDGTKIYRQASVTDSVCTTTHVDTVQQESILQTNCLPKITKSTVVRNRKNITWLTDGSCEGQDCMEVYRWSFTTVTAFSVNVETLFSEGTICPDGSFGTKTTFRARQVFRLLTSTFRAYEPVPPSTTVCPIDFEYGPNAVTWEFGNWYLYTSTDCEP